MLNEYIGKVPKDYFAHELRAYIYFYLKEFQKCLDETTFTISLASYQGGIFNLRGVCYKTLNDMEKACHDFKKAASLDDENAKRNVDRYCKEN